ncbi:MAG: enoyl-CoA hydratase/isomerase family protein [Alphaproteobacteria bacterium]|nr:enoyl-CoA hydratase/isomerase family protein [Alphaproteobacteria bacterium]
MARHIRLEIHDRIATITLDDEARLNAMGLAMREELVAALRALEAGGEADGLIITGAGSRAFSAGADINELRTRTPASDLGSSAQLRREVPRLLETLRLPSVAAINGHCLGAGLELALACTFRLASDRVKLGLPEINLGVIPGSGGTQRLARLVGLGKAMEMVLLGEPVTAEAARDMGLVHAVHAPEALLPAAVALARKLQAKAPFALMAARDAVLRSVDADLLSGIDYENKLFALCLASGEMQEGTAAFLAKRPPDFRTAGRRSPA